MTITNTKYTGRAMTLQMEDTLGGGVYSTIGGVRAKSVTINNEEVDITDGDDDTWKKLLEGAGVRSLALSVSGFITNNAAFELLQAKAFAGNIWRLKINFADSDNIIGLFLPASVELNGEYNGAQQFSASLSSADTPALTAA